MYNIWISSCITFCPLSISCTPIYNYGLLRRWTSRIVNLWGLFSQVDNSGCPPTKMAIIVLLTEQWTKNDKSLGASRPKGLKQNS
jgi:hypothetical protein